jgi:EAL domain-containing protein (putative c-di-GMP-specific phosphodiesterase class I)
MAFDLLGEFRRAIAQDELRLLYQPQFEVSTRRLVGAEALVRWQHPRLGLLSPSSFLPVAERTSLMRPLLEWVLRTALRETKASGVHVAVNLAMRNVLEPGLGALVRAALSDADRQPSDLTLEVTETGVMLNPGLAIRVLDELRTMGCRVSIDDFGTGYSSLTYLQRLPVHEVKIDRSFVIGIPQDKRNLSIVQASIALAHGLGLVVVAEGVELDGNLAALLGLGCDRAQGYLLGKPAPVETLPTIR